MTDDRFPKQKHTDSEPHLEEGTVLGKHWLDTSVQEFVGKIDSNLDGLAILCDMASSHEEWSTLNELNRDERWNLRYQARSIEYLRNVVEVYNRRQDRYKVDIGVLLHDESEHVVGIRNVLARASIEANIRADEQTSLIQRTVSEIGEAFDKIQSVVCIDHDGNSIDGSTLVLKGYGNAGIVAREYPYAKPIYKKTDAWRRTRDQEPLLEQGYQGSVICEVGIESMAVLRERNIILGYAYMATTTDLLIIDNEGMGHQLGLKKQRQHDFNHALYRALVKPFRGLPHEGFNKVTMAPDEYDAHLQDAVAELMGSMNELKKTYPALVNPAA